MKHTLVIVFTILLLTGCASVAYDTTKTAGSAVVGTGKLAVKAVGGAAKLVTAPFRN